MQKERADAGRDGRTKFSSANGNREQKIPSSADHKQDWQPYPVDPYPAESAIVHKYSLMEERLLAGLHKSDSFRCGEFDESLKSKMAQGPRIGCCFCESQISVFAFVGQIHEVTDLRVTAYCYLDRISMDLPGKSHQQESSTVYSIHHLAKQAA